MQVCEREGARLSILRGAVKGAQMDRSIEKSKVLAVGTIVSHKTSLICLWLNKAICFMMYGIRVEIYLIAASRAFQNASFFAPLTNEFFKNYV